MAKLLFFLLVSLLTLTYALPEVKLGRTTISGRAISDKVEFFGGERCPSSPVNVVRNIAC
jgi:hypothetical protein